MTAEEALAAAEAEGLPLVVNARDHKNGHAYKHVSWASGAYNLSYKNKAAAPDGSTWRRQQFLGCARTTLIFAFAPSNPRAWDDRPSLVCGRRFATAEEAALVYARLVGKEAAELENSQAERAAEKAAIAARESAQSKEKKRAAKAAERIAEKEAKVQAKAQAKVQAAKVRCAFH